MSGPSGPSSRGSAGGAYNAGMNAASAENPAVRLKIERRSNHPWIFQKMVEKPPTKPRPGSIVEVYDRDGTWCGRGFYNGHSRIALRILTTDPDEAIDEAWFRTKIAAAVALRRDLLVVEFFSAGAFRHREWIFAALEAQFPGCTFWWFADEHVQKQESFDLHQPEAPKPVVITEHGIQFRAAPGSAHKTGFFADQRDNREWLSRQVEGRSVLDLCCNTGGFAVYAAARGASEVVGVDIDEDVIAIAKQNLKLNAQAAATKTRFIHADIFPWLRDAAARGEAYDVVILDPAKMTRDREQVIPALKKYLDMNKLALGVCKPGALFATFSCTGLVSEEEFLDMLRRAAFYANRTVQVIKVAGAGADHPWLAHVQESRYLKAAFCRVLD